MSVRTSQIQLALACAVALPVPASTAAAGPLEPPSVDAIAVYDGYPAFYATLPNPLFTPADRKPLARVVGPAGGYALRWRGQLTAATAPLQVDIAGRDIAVAGQRQMTLRRSAFPGERPTALGDRARLFANDRGELCVEGVAPSASGTAARHVHVSLLLPVGGGYQRFELPSLFASCEGAWRDDAGAVRFFEVRYRWRESSPAPEGVDFFPYALFGGRISPIGQPLRADFVEPDNVYRFAITPSRTPSQR